jgi:AcrR family transcriptional regulator
MGLRDRKRLAAMQHIQRVALELFQRHGYGAVSIEAIAREAEVGTASVYRYFGTKDRIVIWDEADEGQVARLLQDIGNGPLDQALARFAAALDAADGEMRKRTLARLSLIASEEALAAQAAFNCARFGTAVTEAVAARSGRSPSFADQVAGRAAAALMSAAIEEWSRRRGRVKLAQLVSQAVAAIKSALDTANEA